MKAGDLLHYDCGMHRGSAPTTDGAMLERFEDQLRAHRSAGPCEIHDHAAPQLTDGGDSCQACGQDAQYHGS